MRVVLVIFILMIMSLWFCNPPKSQWEIDLERIPSDSLFQNDYEGWELSSEEKYPNSVLYEIRKQDADTVKLLGFYRSSSGVSVKEYLKFYPIDNNDTCYVKMVSSDTLYFYRQNGEEKHFIVGEYGYRFEFMLLDSSELNYYLEHEDSLIRVRGNNLPKLIKDP